MREIRSSELASVKILPWKSLEKALIWECVESSQMTLYFPSKSENSWAAKWGTLEALNSGLRERNPFTRGELSSRVPIALGCARPITRLSERINQEMTSPALLAR